MAKSEEDVKAIVKAEEEEDVVPHPTVDAGRCRAKVELEEEDDVEPTVKARHEDDDGVDVDRRRRKLKSEPASPSGPDRRRVLTEVQNLKMDSKAEDVKAEVKTELKDEEA